MGRDDSGTQRRGGDSMTIYEAFENEIIDLDELVNYIK